MSVTTRYLLDHLNHDDLVSTEGPGPWQAFVPDVGWTASSLRYRLLPSINGLQFEGVAVNNQPVNTTLQLGVLPVGYRPQRQQVGMMALTGSGGYGYGFLIFNVNGVLLVWWGIAGNQIYPSCIVAMD